MKKLNWSTFSLVLTLSCLAAAANENINTFNDWIILVVLFGFPFSLLFAYMSKKE